MKKSLLLGLLFTATCKPVLDLNLENRSLSDAAKTPELPRRTNVLTRIACLDDLARKPRPSNWIRELQKRETSGTIKTNFRNKYNDDFIFYLLDNDYSYQEIETTPNDYSSIYDQRSLDNRLILRIRNDIVELWDSNSDQGLKKTFRHKLWIRFAQFSSDNKFIFTASGQKVKLWDTYTGQGLRTFKHKNFVNSAKFSSDNRYVLTASSDLTSKLWNANTGECLQTLKHNNYVSSAQFSSDNRLILTTSDDETKLWDAQTGKCIKIFKHNNCVNSAQFSADNRFVITASSDRTAKLWDTNTGECLQTFKHDDAFVKLAKFSSNNRFVITTSSDNTAKLWDASTGQCLQTFKHDDGFVNSVISAHFSADNRLIITHSHRYTKLWEIKPNLKKLNFKPDKPMTLNIYLPIIALSSVITGITVIGSR